MANIDREYQAQLAAEKKARLEVIDILIAKGGNLNA